MEILRYEPDGRPVYRNEDLPHEEDRNVYCPNPCKFRDSCWMFPCIIRPELTEIKAVGQVCFFKLDDRELTCSQVEEAFNRNTPNNIRVDGSMVDSKYIQIIWKDNICPVQFIRDIIGNDLTCIENISFNTTLEINKYHFYFECHDLVKAEQIKNGYLQVVDNYFDGRASAVLETVLYDNATEDLGDDYVYFYFELEDVDCHEGVNNFCTELNLSLA